MLEKIGSECFRSSTIQEVTLPGTLKEIGSCPFADCFYLNNIYVEDKCEISLLNLGTQLYTHVCPRSVPLPGGVPL